MSKKEIVGFLPDQADGQKSDREVTCIEHLQGARYYSRPWGYERDMLPALIKPTDQQS